MHPRLGILLLVAALWQTRVLVAATCVMESDFGFNVNCAVKKSGLFRVRNLGGVKAHIGVGFSVGDELGFKESLSNIESNRRRAWTGSKAHMQMVEVLHKKQGSRTQFGQRRHDPAQRQDLDPYNVQRRKTFRKPGYKAQVQLAEALYGKQRQAEKNQQQVPPQARIMAMMDGPQRRQQPQSEERIAHMVNGLLNNQQTRRFDVPLRKQQFRNQGAMADVLSRRQDFNVPINPFDISKLQAKMVDMYAKKQQSKPQTQMLHRRQDLNTNGSAEKTKTEAYTFEFPHRKQDSTKNPQSVEIFDTPIQKVKPKTQTRMPNSKPDSTKNPQSIEVPKAPTQAMKSKPQVEVSNGKSDRPQPPKTQTHTTDFFPKNQAVTVQASVISVSHNYQPLRADAQQAEKFNGKPNSDKLAEAAKTQKLDVSQKRLRVKAEVIDVSRENQPLKRQNMAALQKNYPKSVQPSGVDSQKSSQQLKTQVHLGEVSQKNQSIDVSQKNQLFKGHVKIVDAAQKNHTFAGHDQKKSIPKNLASADKSPDTENESLKGKTQVVNVSQKNQPFKSHAQIIDVSQKRPQFKSQAQIKVVSQKIEPFKSHDQIVDVSKNNHQFKGQVQNVPISEDNQQLKGHAHVSQQTLPFNGRTEIVDGSPKALPLRSHAQIIDGSQRNPPLKGQVQMKDVSQKIQPFKSHPQIIDVSQKNRPFPGQAEIVDVSRKNQPFKVQAQIVVAPRDNAQSTAQTQAGDMANRRQDFNSPPKQTETLRNGQVFTVQDHMENVFQKRQGVDFTRTQDDPRSQAQEDETAQPRQGKLNNYFMTRSVPPASMLDSIPLGVPPPQQVFQPRIPVAMRRDDLLLAAIPPFKPIPPAPERPDVDLRGNSRSDIPTPSLVGVAVPSFSKMPASISRISAGPTYQRGKKPEVMAVVVPIKRKSSHNDKLSSTDFALRTLASPSNEISSSQTFQPPSPSAANTLKGFLAANNITEEMLETALLQRQQQLLAKARVKTTTTTTTPRPTITRPRNPASSFGKVMNAPREYYPVGYDKNFDDNFASRVELPETSFYCGDQKHFPGLYADEDLGCMVFHVCALTDDGLITKSFLCPESTLFDQAILKCNWWFYVDCKNSKKLYDSNIPVSKSYQLMKALTFFSGYKKEAAKSSEKD